MPGASFQVHGASLAEDAALVSASLEMKWGRGWSLAVMIDSEFSDSNRAYVGSGQLRYEW